MGLTIFHQLVWLFTMLTLTTQELVKLNASPYVTAKCGEQVTLNCNVSSSQNGLSVKHMEWSHGGTTLCSVDREGNLLKHPRDASDFHCDYKHGHLSLIFHQVHPLDITNSGSYICKLKSNKGSEYMLTTVKLEECVGNVEVDMKNDYTTCVFHHVYPDGDVHWFHGSNNLSNGHQHEISTHKSVSKEGWLYIGGHLRRKSSDKPYNCSLMSTKSGKYIASTLVQNVIVRSPSTATQVKNGVESKKPMRTFWFILISLAACLDLPK